MDGKISGENNFENAISCTSNLICGFKLNTQTLGDN